MPEQILPEDDGRPDPADPGSRPPAGPGNSRPLRTFRMSQSRRIGDAIAGQFIRLGVVPHSYLLTTVGRKTGRLRTVPVTIVERDGRRWLVAPYGPVAWVHNTRAAGRVLLGRRGTPTEYTVREVPPDEAGPVLKQYLAITRPPRAYFRAAPDAPVQQFIDEADQHPVFELTPVEQPA